MQIRTLEIAKDRLFLDCAGSYNGTAVDASQLVAGYILGIALEYTIRIADMKLAQDQTNVRCPACRTAFDESSSLR